MPKHHPISDAEIHVFKNMGDEGVKYIAIFYPYNPRTIFFRGETHIKAVAKAEAFRRDTVEKHETAFLAWQNSLKKARKAREK